MAEFPVVPAAPLSGAFVTAEMQVALAKAQALAYKRNEEEFLLQMERVNDDVNAQALVAEDVVPPPYFFTDPLLSPGGVAITELSTEEFLAEFEAGLTDGLAAAQALQKDVQQLQEAQSEATPAPLDGADRVELSVDAQVAAVNNDAQQDAALAALAYALRPFADKALSPELLAQIQARLAATMQNPVQLSLRTLSSAMHMLAGLQAATPLLAGHAAAVGHGAQVAPISAIGRAGIGGGAL